MANVDEVVTWLGNWVDDFDMTRPGMNQSLGRDLADVMVARILDRCAHHEAPDGTIWLMNSDTPTPWMPDGYRQWKDDHYGWDEPNKRTGQMLSKKSMGGATTITKHQVLVAYGTKTKPTRSDSPSGYIDDDDKEVTDLEKAEWAHMEGPHKPKREFFGVGQGDAEALVECAQNNLNDYILATK